MSRIGNAPIQIPTTVTVAVTSSEVKVQGPKGNTVLPLPYGVSVSVDNQTIHVKRNGESRSMKALHGVIRAELANDIYGVTEGWKKTLELSGVGYRASLAGANLVLSVGFSHQITIEPPTGIQFAIVDGKIVVSGIDKQVVGQVAANVHAVKEPEPYKGKGIKYQGERIRKKAGKSAKAVGGGK